MIHDGGFAGDVKFKGITMGTFLFFIYCLKENYRYQSSITGREFENEWELCDIWLDKEAGDIWLA